MADRTVVDRSLSKALRRMDWPRCTRRPRVLDTPLVRGRSLELFGFTTPTAGPEDNPGEDTPAPG